MNYTAAVGGLAIMVLSVLWNHYGSMRKPRGSVLVFLLSAVTMALGVGVVVLALIGDL
jgi:hypothetical protein